MCLGYPSNSHPVPDNLVNLKIGHHCNATPPPPSREDTQDTCDDDGMMHAGAKKVQVCVHVAESAPITAPNFDLALSIAFYA